MGDSTVCDCQASKAANEAKAEETATKVVENEVKSEETANSTYAAGAANTAGATNTAGAANAANSVINNISSKLGGNTKMIAIIAGGAVAFIIVVILCACLLGGGGYKAPVKGLVDLFNKGEKDPFAYIEYTLDPPSVEFYKSAWNIAKKSADMKDDLNDTKEEIEEFYDDNKGLKLSVDFVSAERMKKKELRNITDNFESRCDYYDDMVEEFEDFDGTDYEDFADELDISKGDAKNFVKSYMKYVKSYKKFKVQDGYTVKIRINGKRDGDSDHTDKFAVRVIKANGKWFILNPEVIYSSIYFDDVDVDTSFSTLYNLTGVNSVNLLN